MKVGDYVRNKYGIAKVIDIENNNGVDILVFDKPICFLVNKETGKIKDDRLLNKLAIIDNIDISKIKSRPEIIDLVQVGDYVNGMLVTNIWVDKETGNIEFEFNNHESYLYPKSWNYESRVTKYKIKSIVTKEQFEAMEYKVEV